MKTDWMIDEPIDFEYHKYKMLGYFQKMAQELDDFKLYPHFQQISLHFANFSNLKGKDQYINLVNELEEIDDEILLSDLEYKNVPEMSPQDYAEYRMIVDFGEEKFKEYFLVAKTIWQTLYETIWLSLLENDEELKRGRGYVFFDYGGRKYLYRYELKKFKRNKNEKKIVVTKLVDTTESFDIGKEITNDKYEANKPGHPVFVLKIKDNTDSIVSLEQTILPMIKRKINSFLAQTVKGKKEKQL